MDIPNGKIEEMYVMDQLPKFQLNPIIK